MNATQTAINVTRKSNTDISMEINQNGGTLLKVTLNGEDARSLCAALAKVGDSWNTAAVAELTYPITRSDNYGTVIESMVHYADHHIKDCYAGFVNENFHIQQYERTLPQGKQ